MEHKWRLSLHRNSKEIVAEERKGPLDSPCWIITSHKPCGGNGTVYIQGKGQVGGKGLVQGEGKSCVYRLVYQREVGDIPPGKLVMHRCDNRMCVNPEHLAVGTKHDNTQDMLRKRRHKYGSKASWAKIDEDIVRAIRKVPIRPGSFVRWADLLEISEATVRDAYYGRTWKILENTG